MRRRWILVVFLLGLAVVMLFALTASAGAKKPEPPHVVIDATGTFDAVGDEYDLEYGVWYKDGDEWVVVDGRIDVKMKIESVGEAYGPYDDGSDWNIKWDYDTTGYIQARIHLVDPDGMRVNKTVKFEVDSVTVSQGYLRRHFFFEGTYEGQPYSGYVGRGNVIFHLYMPVLGDVLGGWGNYHIVKASGGDDFSYYLNDPAVDPGY